MGDVGDDFNTWRDHKREQRRLYGMPCPECLRLQPKRDATILLPGQRCKVDGYRDRRPSPIHPPAAAPGAAHDE